MKAIFEKPSKLNMALAVSLLVMSILLLLCANRSYAQDKTWSQFNQNTNTFNNGSISNSRIQTFDFGTNSFTNGQVLSTGNGGSIINTFDTGTQQFETGTVQKKTGLQRLIPSLFGDDND